MNGLRVYGDVYEERGNEINELMQQVVELTSQNEKQQAQITNLEDHKALECEVVTQSSC